MKVASAKVTHERERVREREREREREQLDPVVTGDHPLYLARLMPGGDEFAADLTLGGYIEMHNRPPAFEGTDGQPYTVDVDTEATSDPERPFAAFFIFLRWAETGAGIMAHLETGNVAYGRTEDDARAAALEFSLYEVKAELDGAITRKKFEPEG